MLTTKQKNVLDYIKAYFKAHGLYPSLEDIRVKFGLASVSTAHHYVEALRERGFLHREDNRPRGMTVTDCPGLVQVPVVGTIAAGTPVETFENQTDFLAVPQDVLPRSGEFFGLRVKGESMVDEDIADGDIVVICRQNTAADGDKVVALINGYETTLKKFYREADRIRLQPANPRLQPRYVTEPDTVVIQGKVVCVARAPKSQANPGSCER